MQFRHAPQQHGSPALFETRRVRPSAVRHIFAAGVMIRKRPQIRAQHMGMMQPVSPTVVTFKLVQHPGQAPIGFRAQTPYRQSICCAILPTERRRTFFGSARRYLNGSGSQRITVVQMLIKILAGFHVVNHRYKKNHGMFNCSPTL